MGLRISRHRHLRLTGASLLALAAMMGATAASAQPGSAAAPAATAPDEDENVVDELIVSGQREADQASLEKKKAADSAIEVVTGNEAGKLPDQNVAEAVRRVTGVSVATDKGEGRYLIIRGIEPNLANVTINNQTASAPEPTDRNVKLDDIPAAMIGSVTVIKSLTPDLDANAIAGQVDIATLSAFDRRGSRFANARVVGGFYEDSDRQAREGDVSFGGLFGMERAFGAVLSVNYSKRPSYSEDVLSTSRQLVNGIDLPAEMDQRVYDPAWRTRTGAVANFDWRPNEENRLFLRLMYSEFDDNEVRNRFRFFFPGDNNLADTTTLPPGYSALSARGGNINSTTARRLNRQRHETTDTTTFSFGGDFKIGPGQLAAQVTHASSEKSDPERDEVEYRAAASTGLAAAFANDFGLLGSLTANAAALDPANYRLNNYRDVSREAGEDLDQMRIDYRLPMDGWGMGSYLKFGAKYLKRDRFQDQTGRTLTAVGATAGARTLAADAGPSVATTFDGRFSFGPTINFESVRAFVDANAANTAFFTINANDQISQSVTSDYRVKETVTAGYVMANLKRGPLTLIPGVRVENTEGETKAIVFQAGVTTLTTPFNSFGKYNYTDVFPGVNLKYEVSPRMLVRAGATTAIGRPPFVDLAPTVTVDTGSNTVTQGNPNLEPQTSLNFDFSVEYYFENQGGVSIALFHKSIKNPVFSTTATGQTGTFGGIALTNAIVNSFGNGTNANLTGLELAYQQPFTFLPAPFDGFGVNLSMTFTKGELDVPGRIVKTPLVGQARRLASAQLYYEKHNILARLAYSYHSSYLDTDGGLNVSDPTGMSDGYFGELGTFDARLAYRVGRQFEVFVEGNNLTDEPDYYFFRTPGRFREAEKYGRSYRVGLSLTY